MTDVLKLARDNADVLGPADAFAYAYVIGSTTTGADRARNAIALRSARVQGPEVYAAVQRMIMTAHAEHLTWITTTQRKWQTNTSRRPKRGRHHDSWSIREKYVRCER